MEIAGGEDIAASSNKLLEAIVCAFKMRTGHIFLNHINISFDWLYNSAEYLYTV